MTEFEEFENIFEHHEQVYVHACFLPPCKTNIIIKPGNELSNPDFTYQTFFIHPRYKSVPTNLKYVKKVDIMKAFNRGESVFAEFKAETQ